MNGTWENMLQTFVHDLRGFAEDEEAAKITKAVAATAP